MAGLRGKDREFWEMVKDWEVIVLMETWIYKERWKLWRKRLPRRYKWGIQMAGRKCKKGRVIGKMVMRVKKVLLERGVEIEVRKEGIISSLVKVWEEIESGGSIRN